MPKGAKEGMDMAAVEPTSRRERSTRSGQAPGFMRNRSQDNDLACGWILTRPIREPSFAPTGHYGRFPPVTQQMKLSEATTLILETAKRMDEIYQRPVFDEFSIIHVERQRHYLCWYRGEARQGYIRDFKQNTALLKKESRSRFTNHYETGAYEFVPDGHGPQAESFVVIGPDLYLILTNTRHTMADISSSPLWLKAQEEFVELCERFRCDPAVVAEDDFREEMPA